MTAQLFGRVKAEYSGIEIFPSFEVLEIELDTNKFRFASSHGPSVANSTPEPVTAGLTQESYNRTT
jgi:hypothetical protein